MDNDEHIDVRLRSAYYPLRRPTTKRAQVRAVLEARIAAELRPGDPIQSERVLVDELGVSRVTVRQAIADLVEAGRLERIHGKGTFVTGPQVNSRLHLTSFSREMRARGLVPDTTVLAGVEEAADHRVSAHLEIPAGAAVVRVERLRLADGTPMAYEIGFYPSALFPDLLDSELGALYDVFVTRYGIVATGADQTISADSADAHQARILDAQRRAPLLVQERVTRSADLVIEYSTSWYRADRYRIHMAVTPEGVPQTA